MDLPGCWKISAGWWKMAFTSFPECRSFPALPLCEKRTSARFSPSWRRLPCLTFTCLPFHQYGEPKYSLLGKRWAMAKVGAPSAAEMNRFTLMAEQAGFRVTVGG